MRDRDREVVGGCFLRGRQDMIFEIVGAEEKCSFDNLIFNLWLTEVESIKVVYTRGYSYVLA